VIFFHFTYFYSVFQKRDSYFVSDKVLLQSKKLRGAFLHTNPRRREETQTQRKRKKQHTQKRFRFDLLFFSSIHICFIYFFFLSAIASHQTLFFLLTIFISALAYSSILFFSSGSQVGFRYFSIWTHIFALFSWICTLYWRFVLTLNFIAAKLHFFYVIS